MVANKLLTAIAVTLLIAQTINAQELEEVEKNNSGITRVSSRVDFSAAVGASVYSASLGATRTHGLLKSNKLRLGYGLRFSGMYGNDLNYTTAPAKLIAEDKVDTFFIGEPISLGLNAVIHIGYQFTPKLYAGFNIDAVGLGFGATNKGRSLPRDPASTAPVSVLARPTSYNVLLVGDNDIGYLKSEFTVGYSISESLMIRAGYDFTFSEYTTQVKLDDANDRFRYKASMFFLGVSYNIESKFD